MGIPMPRFAEKDVKVYLGIRLLTIITFVSMLAVISVVKLLKDTIHSVLKLQCSSPDDSLPGYI